MLLVRPFPPISRAGRRSRAARRFLLIETPQRPLPGATNHTLTDARVLPDAAYDCASIGLLVRALGGETQIAAAYMTRPEHISEWVYRNSIPPGWHLPLLLQACSKGKTVAPSVFGLKCSSTEARTFAGLMVAMRHFLEQGGPAHV